MYVVTGAGGHLGGALLRQLTASGHRVRGLILPTEQPGQPSVEWVQGDVCDRDSLRALFAGIDPREAVVVHAAGLVELTERASEAMWRVNVEGTRNVLALLSQLGVGRLVYVSSVHAIPERRDRGVMCEVEQFSPQWVEGGYAKSKAQATQLVLEAARAGLNAVVVHPSGILGPYEARGNHLVQMIGDYMQGRLPACVRGGYDLVDVRDVAAGCLAAAERGRRGACYILSNRAYEISEVLAMVRERWGGRRLPVLPLWMARAALPLLAGGARLKKQRPLYTRYTLYALKSNDRFSHDRATFELGYRPRDLLETVADTVAWLSDRHEARRLNHTIVGQTL